MRKLIMKMSLSVDGFVAGPNGKNDWIFKNSDEASREWSVAQFREAGLIIMGSKSFQQMAPYWATATGPFAGPMNEIPKALFTKKGFAGVDFPGAEKSPAEASWAGARVFDGDLAEGIRTLKQEPGKPIVAIAGAGFMRSLITTGLIDTYYLITHPLLLGAGLPIFTDLAKPVDLKLVDVKVFPGGIFVQTYHPA
ncbi:dihydrofolate reductase family protein [Flavitalea flava]